MRSNEVDELTGAIHALENGPEARTLKTLKRRRRALVAGIASGVSRRAKIEDRDGRIRAAHAEAGGRYGTIVDLARRFGISLRQLTRIVHAQVRQHRTPRPVVEVPPLPPAEPTLQPSPASTSAAPRPVLPGRPPKPSKPSPPGQGRLDFPDQAGPPGFKD
jgi:hypothetical protein